MEEVVFTELSKQSVLGDAVQSLDSNIDKYSNIAEESNNQQFVFTKDTTFLFEKRDSLKKKQRRSKSKIKKAPEVEQKISITESTPASKIDGAVNDISNKHKGTGVLQQAPVHTENSFIQATQEVVQEKLRKEAEEVSNVDPEFPYKAVPILTDAELQLFNFMKNNLCQIDRIEILSKVRLGDIVNIDTRVTNDMKYYWKVTNKHVDFLICKRNTMDIICAVELDDYTHETEKAKQRDMFVMQVLDSVGIKTVRIRKMIRAIENRDLDLLNDYINTALAPKCQECGLRMIPKRARDGHRFYACSDFIHCRSTIDIDPRGERLP